MAVMEIREIANAGHDMVELLKPFSLSRSWQPVLKSVSGKYGLDNS